MRVAGSYFVVLGLLCSAKGAVAQPTKGYNWRADRAPRKGYEPYPEPPKPREFPRREFELAAEAGPNLPVFEAFGPGVTGSLAALWKNNWAGLGLRAGYLFQPAQPYPVEVAPSVLVTRTGPDAQIVIVVLAPRFSLPAWDRIEPWVEPLGAYLWPLGAFESTVGCDFYVTRDLRLGLVLRYSFVAPHSVDDELRYNQDPDPFHEDSLGVVVALRGAWGVGTEVH